MTKIQIFDLRCLAVGVIALVGGVSTLVAKRRKLRNWPKAEATVNLVFHDKDGNLKLTVLFKDSADRSWRAVIGASDGQNLGLGSVVSVAYDPLNPESAIFADGWQIGLGVGAMIALGLICTFLAVWVFAHS